MLFGEASPTSSANSSRNKRRSDFVVLEYRAKSAPFTTSGRFTRANTGPSRFVKCGSRRARSSGVNASWTNQRLTSIVAGRARRACRFGLLATEERDGLAGRDYGASVGVLVRHLVAKRTLRVDRDERSRDHRIQPLRAEAVLGGVEG